MKIVDSGISYVSPEEIREKLSKGEVPERAKEVLDVEIPESLKEGKGTYRERLSAWFTSR